MTSLIIREVSDINVDELNRSLGTDGQIAHVRDFGQSNPRYLADGVLEVFVFGNIENVIPLLVSAGCDFVGGAS